MKKLITLILVLTGMVSTASADGLTLYMDATGFLSGNSDEAFAVWNHSTSTFIKFTNISGNYYKASLPEGYTSLNLVRYDKTQEPSWDSKWNQTGNITPTAANNYIIVTGLNGDACPYTQTGAHKLYVKNMESSDAVKFYVKEKTGWTEVNGSEPGGSMEAETIKSETWYSFLNLTGKELWGYFSIETGDYKKTGTINPDLSSSDQFYHYYPSKYLTALSSETLFATPATVHFRVDVGSSKESLKWYMWDCDGMRTDRYTTETVGGVDWITFESYIPSFSIQFYTYNNGDDNSQNDKSWGTTVSLGAGETSYYFTALPRKTIDKMESNYSIAYWSNTEQWLGNNISVSSLPMTGDGDFKFKATIDNTAGNYCRYVITPSSNIVDGKLVSGDKAIAPSSGNFDINGFESHESAAIPCIWAQIDIKNVVGKFDITFNFATMQWTSKPYYEASVSNLGYATFSKTATAGTKMPSGVDAYIITTVGTNTVQLSKLADNAIIPSNAGVIISADEDTYKMYAVAYGTATTDVTGNKLVGTGDSSKNLSDESNVYIFANAGKGIGFYTLDKEKGTEIGANKAYLQLGSGEAREFLGFETNEATEISDVKQSQTGLFNGDIYNLQGARLARFQKGLNIVNGKKIIVK